LKDEIEAEIVKEEYSGWSGWVTEYHVSINNTTIFEDVIKKYEGKKVKITIQELVT
jgi:hypothetical protein